MAKLSLRKVSRDRGVSAAWVSDRIREGKIEATRSGRALLVEEDAIDDIILEMAASVIRRRKLDSSGPGEGKP